MIKNLLTKAATSVTDAATSGVRKATRMLTTSRESRTVGDYYGDVTSRLAKDSSEDSSAMLKVLRGEETASNLGLSTETGKVLSAVKGRFNEGTLSSNEAIGAMYKNVQDTGEVFGGLSRAGETLSQAPGFGALGNPSNIIGSAAMGAFVGAGASSITGGDTTEGAIIGGMVGAGGSVGARVFRESLGAIEESVMKKALGSDFKTKELVETMNIPGGGIRSDKLDRTYMDTGEYIKGNKIIKTYDQSLIQTMQQQKLNKSNSSYLPIAGGVDVETGRVLSARNQNLDAISQINLKDAPDNLNFVDRHVIGKMQDKKAPSIGVQSRFATLSGAALAGMAFTSSAGSDKRRGFNKDRGNRF